jgi:hypothetical protein
MNPTKPTTTSADLAPVLADLRACGWTILSLCARHVQETRNGWALPEMTMFENESIAGTPCDLCLRRPTAWDRLREDRPKLTDTANPETKP